MGYRSEVALCLNPDAHKHWQTLLEKAAQENEHYKIITELLAGTAQMFHDPSGAIAWTWDEVKWYLGTPDIDFMEAFLRTLDCDQYLFIRIGEENEDTEVHGCLWDNPFAMCLVRGVVFD